MVEPGGATRPAPRLARASWRPAHVMAKPVGARCNLRCDYCFYLGRSALYPAGPSRMPDSVLEAYIVQTAEAQRDFGHVTFSWQGGEPTLAGLDHFRLAMELEERHVPPGMTVENTLQTNGVRLDERWAAFLREHSFLVGLSLDGPRYLHDAYRHDPAGASVFRRVEAAARLLQRHGVDFNVLCTVNAANAGRPLDVYRYLRDDLGARFLQFVPIVEVLGDARRSEEPRVSGRSVAPEAYGRFLSSVFDEWLRHDVGDVFVQTFDAVLAAYVFGESSACVFRRECGSALVLEHNGDLYSCDHYVDAGHLLGNILDTPVAELVRGERQLAFGRAKHAELPRQCRSCRYVRACNGECPKNRIARTADGRTGLNFLCPGLRAFFAHTERPFRLMAEALRRGAEARDAAAVLALEGRSARGIRR